MEITDFGKNTFQLEIFFKIDIISPDFTLRLAQQLISDSHVFSIAFKDAQSGDSILSRGAGTQQYPLLQLRLNSNKLVLWAGWYTAYSKWVELRDALLDLIAKQAIVGVSSNLLESLISSAFIVVPQDRIKKPEERPDLAAIIAKLREFIPEEFLAVGAGASVFNDVSNKRIIETFYGGNVELKEDTATYRNRWQQFNAAEDIRTNVARHTKIFDQLFLRYHAATIVPMIKSGSI